MESLISGPPLSGHLLCCTDSPDKLSQCFVVYKIWVRLKYKEECSGLPVGWLTTNNCHWLVGDGIFLQLRGGTINAL